MAHAIRFPVLAAALLLAAGLPALAQEVHEIIPGGDLVNGTVESPGEVERIPFRTVEGAFLTLQVKAAKKSPLLPELTVLGIDRTPDTALAAALKTSKKGNSVVLKKFPVDATGLRWLEIRGASGTTGGWQLKTKVKLPKKAAGAGAVAGGEGSFLFTGPGNATANISVTSGKKSPAVPVFGSLLGPGAGEILVDFVATTKKGFSLKGQALPTPGSHELRFTADADGTWKGKASFKLPRFSKRTLLDSQILTDPVLTSLTPDAGVTSDLLEAVLEVDFGQPGATVVFRKPGLAVTVLPAQIEVGEHSASFSVPLASFQKGVYDLEFTNPDGGMDVLEDAFTVENAPATPAGVVPSMGFDNQVIALTVTGTFFTPGAGVLLRMGGETIPGTGATGGSSQVQAQFDLRGRTTGFWDVVVQNDDAPEGVLPSAFELRNSPPLLTAMTPGHNLDGDTIDAVITGSDIDATPAVRLTRAGATDIPGTSVLWVSGTEVNAVFDVAGAGIGTWDLVLTNPDGQSATLPACFRTTGSLADPSGVITPGGTLDAPPSVAHGATQDEFAVAWVDAATAAWTVYVQAVDATGSALGSPVSVSSSASTVPKKDVAVAWDSTNDEFLVTWSEIRTVNLKSGHPSYQYVTTGTSAPLFVVFGQRFRASDLAAQGSNVQIVDSFVSNGWAMDEFHNFRSVPVWDPKNRVWVVHWMQEWDTSGTYSKDDYDVLNRTLDPSSGNLGAVVGVATTPEHEGEPHALWDPVDEVVRVVYNEAHPPTTTRVFLTLDGTQIAQDTSADLVDPKLVLDPDSDRILVTWTRKPVSGDTRTEALLVKRGDPGTTYGIVTTVGSGSGSHRDARPLYNAAMGQAMVAWTLETTGGDLSVRVRRVDTAASILTLLGTEAEASGGSDDEAAPAALYNPESGESVIFWLKTLSYVSGGGYVFSLFDGTWQGEEVWIHRYQ